MVCLLRKNAHTATIPILPQLLTLLVSIVCSALKEALVQVPQLLQLKLLAPTATGVTQRMSRSVPFPSIPAQLATKTQVLRAQQGPLWPTLARSAPQATSAREQTSLRLHVWRATSVQKAPSLRHSSPAQRLQRASLGLQH